MGSLKDQLVKTGLVDSNRAKQAGQKKPKQGIQARRKAAPAVDEGRARAERQRAEAAERNRQLNQRRQAEADRKAAAAQLKQLIKTHALPKDDGDVAFNFTDRNAIQRVYVTPAVHKQLVNGAVAIVRVSDRYRLVPAAIVARIRERDPAWVVLYNDPDQPKTADQQAEADHPVPDDLMW